MTHRRVLGLPAVANEPAGYLRATAGDLTPGASDTVLVTNSVGTPEFSSTVKASTFWLNGTLLPYLSYNSSATLLVAGLSSGVSTNLRIHRTGKNIIARVSEFTITPGSTGLLTLAIPANFRTDTQWNAFTTCEIGGVPTNVRLHCPSTFTTLNIYADTGTGNVLNGTTYFFRGGFSMSWGNDSL